MSRERLSKNTITSLLLGERRIALRWRIVIEAYEYMVGDLMTRSSLKSVGEAAMEYAIMRLPVEFAASFQVGAPDLITQSIFDAERFQLTLPVSAKLTLSEATLRSSRIQGKRCIWGVPSQIDLRGSIATITRTLDLNCYELNLFSGAVWQDLPAEISPSRKVCKPLSLPVGIRGV